MLTERAFGFCRLSAVTGNQSSAGKVPFKRANRSTTTTSKVEPQRKPAPTHAAAPRTAEKVSSVESG